MTLTEKILARAAGKPSVQAGNNIWVNADVLMTHDVCGPGTIGVFKREFGKDAKVWDKNKIVIIPDHYIFTTDSLSNRNVDILRDFVREQDIPYFYDVIDDPNGHWVFDPKKGNLKRQFGSRYAGVCHTALPAKGHTRPGEVLFGTDSHTCMAGAFNLFAAHPVHFVENHKPDVVHRNDAPIQQVDDPPRRAHQNLRAVTQEFHLRGDLLPAIHRHRTNRRVLAQTMNLRIHLHGQFARRNQDDRLRGRALHRPLQYRNGKSRRLPRPGAGLAQNVHPSQRPRNEQHLDVGRGDEAGIRQCPQNGRSNPQRRKRLGSRRMIRFITHESKDLRSIAIGGLYRGVSEGSI